MGRRSLRWLVFSAFVLAVVGMAIFNTVSNRRLTSDLIRGDEQAYAELVERPDAVAVFATLTETNRLELSRRLATWRSESAPDLIFALLREPTPTVRRELTASLARIVERGPEGIVRHYDVSEPERRTALVEACVRAGDPGIEAAAAAFADSSMRRNAAVVLFRAGVGALNRLDTLLSDSDPSTVLDVADLYAALGAPASATLQRNLGLVVNSEPSLRDRALTLCARLDLPGLWDQYLEAANDRSAPVELRRACVAVHIRAGLADRVRDLAGAPERAIRELFGPAAQTTDTNRAASRSIP